MQTEKLAKAISMLDERERKIILLRYGISEPALTQKETADRLGISRSYVSRLEKKALDTLRKSLS
jgi:RNA polymerase sporulation-specific sigma factor